MGAVGACERSHWGRRRSPRWDREAREWCTKMGAAGACDRNHWGCRWGSIWGRETFEGCAKWARRAHATAAIGAVGGAPFEATRRVRSVPKWARWPRNVRG
eukprot:3702959-Pyramimonas_sp.AAC.1